MMKQDLLESSRQVRAAARDLRAAIEPAAVRTLRLCCPVDPQLPDDLAALAALIGQAKN